jgi:hypothetical protein
MSDDPIFERWQREDAAHERRIWEDGRKVGREETGVSWRSTVTAPRDGTPILVCDDKTCLIVRWLESGWCDGQIIWDADAFEYWMPLPTPPK